MFRKILPLGGCRTANTVTCTKPSTCWDHLKCPFHSKCPRSFLPLSTISLLCVNAAFMLQLINYIRKTQQRSASAFHCQRGLAWRCDGSKSMRAAVAVDWTSGNEELAADCKETVSSMIGWYDQWRWKSGHIFFNYILFPHTNSWWYICFTPVQMPVLLWSLHSAALEQDGRAFFFLDLHPICTFSSKPFCTLTFNWSFFSLNLFLGNPPSYSDQMQSITQTDLCKCYVLSL